MTIILSTINYEFGASMMDDFDFIQCEEYYECTGNGEAFDAGEYETRIVNKKTGNFSRSKRKTKGNGNQFSRTATTKKARTGTGTDHKV